VKLVKAFVREDMTTVVTGALHSAGVDGMTMTRAAGTGRSRHLGVYRGHTYLALVQVCVVEVMVPDAAADEIVRILLECAHTGHAGDGHVMVLPIEEHYSIRTRWLDVA